MRSDYWRGDRATTAARECRASSAVGHLARVDTAISVRDSDGERTRQLARLDRIEIQDDTVDFIGLHAEIEARNACTDECCTHASHHEALVKALGVAIENLGSGGGAGHGVTNLDGNDAGVAASRKGIAASQLWLDKGYSEDMVQHNTKCSVPTPYRSKGVGPEVGMEAVASVATPP